MFAFIVFRHHMLLLLNLCTCGWFKWQKDRQTLHYDPLSFHVNINLTFASFCGTSSQQSADPPDMAAILTKEMWPANQCPVLFTPSWYQHFSALTFSKPPMCLSQRPARGNLVISEDSLWMDSWLAVTDAAVCIVCLICVWTLLSESQCVVALLLMCSSDALQCFLDTRCSSWLPSHYSNNNVI